MAQGTEDPVPRKPIAPRLCVICGGQYTPRTGSQKTCGPEHSRDYGFRQCALARRAATYQDRQDRQRHVKGAALRFRCHVLARYRSGAWSAVAQVKISGCGRGIGRMCGHVIDAVLM